MTTLDQLVRACLAAAGDDTPRLVLADWLEDDGHPGAAALLRAAGWWRFIPRGPAVLDRDARRSWLEWRTYSGSPASAPGPLVVRVPPGVRPFPRCWCGVRWAAAEFSGGAWHCPGCPPQEPEHLAAAREAGRRAGYRAEQAIWDAFLGVGGDPPA